MHCTVRIFETSKMRSARYAKNENQKFKKGRNKEGSELEGLLKKVLGVSQLSGKKSRTL